MPLTPYRRPVIVALELGLVVLANVLAFLLRFDGVLDSHYIGLLLQTLPLLVAVRALLFIPFRLYEGLWRYTSLWDLRNILSSVILSTLLMHLIVNSWLGLGYPRSIILIDALLLVCFMGGTRLSRRVFRELRGPQREKGVLIYGAGDAGEMVVRDMKNNPFYSKDPIGFVDDDQKKVGLRIHGVPVLGTRKNLNEIMARGRVHEVLIALPGATARELREVLKTLEPYKVPITTLPNLRDLLNGKVTVSQIRSLALEDLLQRTPVGLNEASVKELIARKRILVTGAGGSIGSELCRQIAKLQPESLIMVEKHEPSIYAIHKDLESTTNAPLIPLLADVTDRRLMSQIFASYSPQIVFHAAAYKHVPLMEMNPCAAIRNNVVGTRVLLQEAQAHDVERFILISTDKAVDPTSVMGATKLIGEYLTQGVAAATGKRFSAVRFGNVLGSAGSVVPLFLKQIQNGGPVTVTHPEMRRYFMLIPEAVQLVMHAATLAESSAVYVLDMGEEFKVVDLARNMIRLSGHIPDDDIRIEFVGMRPGEKLSEKLIQDHESIEKSTIAKILRVKSKRSVDPSLVEDRVLRLEAAALEGDQDEVLRLLQRITSEVEARETPVRQRILASGE
jgi:FlaA1/EpsC-like NDP-sugar epimerase